MCQVKCLLNRYHCLGGTVSCILFLSVVGFGVLAYSLYSISPPTIMNGQLISSGLTDDICTVVVQMGDQIVSFKYQVVDSNCVFNSTDVYVWSDGMKTPSFIIDSAGPDQVPSTVVGVFLGFCVAVMCLTTALMVTPSYKWVIKHDKSVGSIKPKVSVKPKVLVETVGSINSDRDPPPPYVPPPSNPWVARTDPTYQGYSEV